MLAVSTTKCLPCLFSHLLLLILLELVFPHSILFLSLIQGEQTKYQNYKERQKKSSRYCLPTVLNRSPKTRTLPLPPNKKPPKEPRNDFYFLLFLQNSKSHPLYPQWIEEGTTCGNTLKRFKVASLGCESEILSILSLNSCSALTHHRGKHTYIAE